MEEVMSNVNEDTVETAIEVVEKSFGKKAAKCGIIGMGVVALAGAGYYLYKKHKAKKAKDTDAEAVDNVKVAERDFADEESDD